METGVRIAPYTQKIKYMTVQELIDELLKIEDKSKDVQDYNGYPVEVVAEDPFTHSISLYYEEDINPNSIEAQGRQPY